MKFVWVPVLLILALWSCERQGNGPEAKRPATDPLKDVELILGTEPPKLIVGGNNGSADKPPAGTGGGEVGGPTTEGTGEEPVANYPVAKPVEGKPGFVISPFNGKVVDVSGIDPGVVVVDPNFPEDDKRYFKVPAFPEPSVEEAPPAGEGDKPEEKDGSAGDQTGVVLRHF